MLQSSVIFLHVLTGVIALCAGSGAMFFKKGSQAHRTTGNVFVATMLIMSLLGGYAAYYKPEVISVLNGLLTAYLVVTAWTSVRHPRNFSKVFDVSAFGVVTLLLLGYLSYGIEAIQVEPTTDVDIPTDAYFLFGGIALIATTSDARLIWGRVELSRRQQVIRHLWRMCIALSIAMASFFTGQPQLFPEFLQNAAILATPAFIILIMMVYWMYRAGPIAQKNG